MDALRDRRRGLLIAGIVQILIGLLAAGFVLVVAAGHEMATRRGGVASGSALASAIVVYGMAAVYFVATGIGSIRCRRWARALSVAISGLWLAAGVVTALVLAIVLPRVLRAAAAANASAVGWTIVGTVAVCGILLPLAFFLFYRRDDVRATCERIDAKPRWTDRVPVAVLALVIVFAFAAVALLANVANPVLNVLGRQVTGSPAALALFAFAALSAVIAVQLYRLKESAWWILVLLQVAGIVYAIYGFATTGASQMAPPGTPAEVAAIYRDPFFIAIVAATWIGYFAFLLYLRRYFAVQLVPRTRRADHSTFSE